MGRGSCRARATRPMTAASLKRTQGLKMNKKLQVVIVFVVGLVAMAVGYAVLKM
ncbi:hypothetical protein D3C87_2143700 [compost metagenome]